MCPKAVAFTTCACSLNDTVRNITIKAFYSLYGANKLLRMTALGFVQFNQQEIPHDIIHHMLFLPLLRPFLPGYEGIHC